MHDSLKWAGVEEVSAPREPPLLGHINLATMVGTPALDSTAVTGQGASVGTSYRHLLKFTDRRHQRSVEVFPRLACTPTGETPVLSYSAGVGVIHGDVPVLARRGWIEPVVTLPPALDLASGVQGTTHGGSWSYLRECASKRLKPRGIVLVHTLQHPDGVDEAGATIAGFQILPIRSKE
jgi:hypothetical protein